MKTSIKTPKAPGAIGPYSQAIVSDNMVFISGQLPIVPETGEFISDEIEDQTNQALTNLSEILSADGCTLENVVKTTVYLNDMADFTRMNQVYETYFTAPFPARVAFEVSALPKNALVEIEAIAVK